MTQAKILVTGATGNVGRHVVTELAAAGVPVRALTRSPEGPRARSPSGRASTRTPSAERPTPP